MKTDELEMDARLARRLVRCAQNNTIAGLWGMLILTPVLVSVHELKTFPGLERCIAAVIGALWGWCLAFWGVVMISRDPDPSNSVLDKPAS